MIEVRWTLRARPLQPTAVVGRGEVARLLARRVLDARGEWRCVVGDGLIVLLGRDLPWVDGVVYLGSSPQAPRLLHDCRSEPDLPPDLLARAVHRRVPGLVAWLREPDLLVPLGEADRIHPPALAKWMDP